MISTFESKIVPGTNMGFAQVWGASDIKSTPDLFWEQVWDSLPISPHRVDTRLVLGTSLGASSIKSIPKLFQEQIWVRPPSSRHQNCSLNCSRNKCGCVLHRVQTKFVPGTNLSGSLHRADTKVVPGTNLGALAIESTPKMFPEQIWVSSIEFKLTRNKFRCVFH